MRRKTHLLLGAAVGLPIAASLSPGLALGGLWWGMVGGGFPDWLDLRSDFRTSLRLRHRGASHSIFIAALMSILFGIALHVLSKQPLDAFGMHIEIPGAAVRPWFLCFLAGIVSHLVSDAMTHSGIQPLLPLSRVTLHLLPKFLRSRYDGYLDTLLRAVSLLALGVAITIYVVNRQA
jgi:membrane-bound metal-dependent hydrolase YbcI (DUF457 family)